MAGSDATKTTELGAVRICMVGGHLDQTGGAELQTIRLARALIRLGADVFVCGYYARDTWARDVSVPLVRVPSLDFVRPGPLRAIARALALTVLLLRFRDRYDLLHVHGLDDAAPVVAMVAWLVHKPMIVKILCAGPHGDIARLRRGAASKARRRLVNRVDRYIALTPEIHRELLDFGVDKQRIVAIPNGLDLEVFRPSSGDRLAVRASLGLGADDKILIVVGRLVVQKRVDLVLRAVAGAEGRIPKARLVVVGDGPLRAELEALARRLETQALFLGVQANVVPWLQASDLFVLASDSEGMSNAVLEAMACGVSVLVSDCEANRAVITDGVDGTMFRAGDEEALRDKLESMLMDAAYRRKVAKAGCERVRSEHSLETVASRYLELYGAVMADHTLDTRRVSMRS